jgi:hypothetical protein
VSEDFKTPVAGTPIQSLDDRLRAAVERQQAAQQDLIKLVLEKDDLLFKARAIVIAVGGALGLVAEGAASSAGVGFANPLIQKATEALIKKAVDSLASHQSDAAKEKTPS